MSYESWHLQLVQWTPTMTLKLIIITCFAQKTSVNMVQEEA